MGTTRECTGLADQCQGLPNRGKCGRVGSLLRGLFYELTPPHVDRQAHHAKHSNEAKRNHYQGLSSCSSSWSQSHQPPPVYVNWQMLPLEVHYAIYESMWIGECLYNFDRAAFSIRRKSDQYGGHGLFTVLLRGLLSNARPLKRLLRAKESWWINRQVIPRLPSAVNIFNYS